MGLDMYLTKEFYVKNWDYMEPDQRHEITVKKGGKIREDIKADKISNIEVDVMYWRKANHIHKWFVDNCQDGVDDCRRAYVPLEKLEELYRTCETVLKASKLVPGQLLESTTWTKEGGEVHNYIEGLVIENPQTAEDLLPVERGCFFGNYEYNEWYLEDIKRTMEVLAEELLGANDEFMGSPTYYYHSSW